MKGWAWIWGWATERSMKVWIKVKVDDGKALDPERVTMGRRLRHNCGLGVYLSAILLLDVWTNPIRD